MHVPVSAAHTHRPMYWTTFPSLPCSWGDHFLSKPMKSIGTIVLSPVLVTPRITLEALPTCVPTRSEQGHYSHSLKSSIWPRVSQPSSTKSIVSYIVFEFSHLLSHKKKISLSAFTNSSPTSSPQTMKQTVGKRSGVG